MAKYCPICNHIAEDSSLYCEECGAIFEQISSNNSMDELLDNYIGKNAKKIKEGNFSISAFLGGGMYLFYRKMWAFGFGYFIAGFLILLLDVMLGNVDDLCSNFVLVSLLILNAFVGIKFKELYLDKAQKDVDNIILKTSDKTPEEVVELCRKKGGTSARLMIVLISLIFLSLASISKIIDMIFDRVYSPEKEDLVERIKVEVPSIFVDKSEFGYRLYKYGYEDNSTEKCTLEINVSNILEYENEEEYLEDYIYLTPSDVYSGISEKEINGQKWHYAQVESKFRYNHSNLRTYYYYAMIYDQYIYTLNFSIYTSGKSEQCSKAYGTIINSLQFK